jgi:hypothetical protein
MRARREYIQLIIVEDRAFNKVYVWQYTHTQTNCLMCVFGGVRSLFFVLLRRARKIVSSS